MPKPVYLTKSRYMAGLQCPRRLWLNVHEPADSEEPEPGSVEEIGLEIGRSAHFLFPDGVRVEHKPWEHTAAAMRTATLMADRTVPAIFEAAFALSGVGIRIDVLERLRHGWWGIREVKGTSEVRDHHYDDVALQYYVLRKNNVRVSSVEILHPNKRYVRGLKGISWPKFFRRVEVKSEAKRRLSNIGSRLEVQLACLCRTEAPAIKPDGHCHDPYSCEHWESCTASKPVDWVFHMPNLGSKRLKELEALGIESISNIPDDFPLASRQGIIRDVTRSKEPFVAPDLAKLLRRSGPPAFYLDFEAMLPAIPVYPGTRPYQVIPFQWSLHCVDTDRAVYHKEFLAGGCIDPRREFAETLIAALRHRWPIIVYSPYEKTRLTELAAAFPDLAKPIARIVRRLSDLLPIIRSSLYHPGFEFSSSIKSVTPVVCPDVTYDDLDEIADGASASTAFWLMASGRANAQKSAHLRRLLGVYCQRDTWAMVRLHQALKTLAAARKTLRDDTP
jgi:hypothetical protein